MAVTKSTGAGEKLAKFLTMVERLKAPGVIQVLPESVVSTMDAVRQAFKGKLNVWEVPSQLADPKEVFLQSFKRAETLLAVVRASSSSDVLRLIEEIVEDGAIGARKGKAWRPVKPSDGWNLLVVAEEHRDREPYFKSAETFPYKLRM